MELYGGNMEFTQEGNCVDGNELETINISVKDGGGGKFFVINTEKWSIDNAEEFLKLLRKVEKAFKAAEANISKEG